MKQVRLLAICSLALAAIGAIFAPLAMGNGYSWLANSISETGAQGVQNAWLGRTTLALSGVGVLLTTVLRLRSWNRIAVASMSLFGLMWCLTAVFSTRSWDETTPFNATESTIHSVLASAMAIVVLGALAVGLSRRTRSAVERALALSLAAAATFLPLAGVLMPGLAGLFQRVMFLFTYFWFLRQATKAKLLANI